MNRLIFNPIIYYTNAISEDEAINMDSIYISLDFYREAYLFLEEKASE